MIHDLPSPSVLDKNAQVTRMPRGQFLTRSCLLTGSFNPIRHQCNIWSDKRSRFLHDATIARHNKVHFENRSQGIFDISSADAPHTEGVHPNGVVGIILSGQFVVFRLPPRVPILKRGFDRLPVLNRTVQRLIRRAAGCTGSPRMNTRCRRDQLNSGHYHRQTKRSPTKRLRIIATIHRIANPQEKSTID